MFDWFTSDAQKVFSGGQCVGECTKDIFQRKRKKKSDAAGSPLAPSVTRRVVALHPSPKVPDHENVGSPWRQSNLGDKFKVRNYQLSLDGFLCSMGMLPKGHGSGANFVEFCQLRQLSHDRISHGMAIWRLIHPHCQSNPTSSERDAWVRAPTLIRSTPEAAISRNVSNRTPPEASSTTCGAC